MRLPPIAAAFVAFAAAGAAYAATVNTVTVRLERPLDRPTNSLVAAGVVWTCTGDTCVSRIERRTPLARDCRDVARTVGRVASFKVGETELDATGLEACNRSAR